MTKKEIIEDLEEHKNHLWMYYECSVIIEYLRSNLDD